MREDTAGQEAAAVMTDKRYEPAGAPVLDLIEFLAEYHEKEDLMVILDRRRVQGAEREQALKHFDEYREERDKRVAARTTGTRS